MLALDVFVKLCAVRAGMNRPDLSTSPQKSIHECLTLLKTTYEHRTAI